MEAVTESAQVNGIPVSVCLSLTPGANIKAAGGR